MMLKTLWILAHKFCNLRCQFSNPKPKEIIKNYLFIYYNINVIVTSNLSFSFELLNYHWPLLIERQIYKIYINAIVTFTRFSIGTFG